MSYAVSVSNVPKEKLLEASQEAIAAYPSFDNQPGSESARAQCLKGFKFASVFVEDHWPDATNVGCTVSGHIAPGDGGGEGTTFNVSLQSLRAPPVPEEKPGED